MFNGKVVGAYNVSLKSPWRKRQIVRLGINERLKMK